MMSSVTEMATWSSKRSSAKADASHKSCAMKKRSAVLITPLLSTVSPIRDPRERYSLKKRRMVLPEEIDVSTVEGRHLFAKAARNAARKEIDEN